MRRSPFIKKQTKDSYFPSYRSLKYKKRREKTFVRIHSVNVKGLPDQVLAKDK